jgi:hypothetical protein
LAAEHLTKAFQQHVATKLFELRVGAGGAAFIALPTPILHGDMVTDLALAPDGSRAAITGTWPEVAGTFSPQTGVRVYDLTTGKLDRFWQVLPPPPPGRCCVFDPTAGSVSWEANGRYLAIDVTLAHCQDCVVRLDTRSAAASVQAASKVIVRTHNRHCQVDWTNTIIAPDGSRVLRSALVFVKIGKHASRTVPHVFTDSAASGKTIGRLSGPGRDNWTLLWSSQHGRAFAIAISRLVGSSRTITAAIHHGGHWTPIPVPARTLTVAW